MNNSSDSHPLSYFDVFAVSASKMLKFVLPVCALIAAVTALTVWPQPQVQTWPAISTEYSMDPYFFNFNATGFPSEYLDDAFRVS